MTLIRTVLDWETAYGKSPRGRDVTLSKMTTEEYVRDPEFKAHGLGVKIEGERAFYVYGADLVRFLREHPWGRTWAICHHTHFDDAIFSWRCGVRPAFLGCTLSMARAVLPQESGSLANLSRLLLGREKGVELASFKDKWGLTAAEQYVMGGYCTNDVDLTADIFNDLLPHFPVSELRLIDWTVRCFTEPVIQVDPVPLIAAYKSERRRKRSLVKQCVTDKDTLASNDKFAGLLLSIGIDPPKKVSPAKIKDGRVNPDDVSDPPQGLLPSFKAPKGYSQEARQQLQAEKKVYPWSYAFGKSDEAFKLLLDHPDPQVQAVCEARMGIKSTIKETRAKRFYRIGSRGAFPVYLNFYGGHTGRFSGGDKQNAQNLNRVDHKDPTAGALRMSWVAPAGHVFVVRDLGQIEARKLCYWAGQEDMLGMFRAGGDPYDFMATKIYGRTIQRKVNPDDKDAGQVGKIVILGCGYSMSYWKLQENVRVGFMGAPGMIFGQDYVAQLGVDVEAFRWRKSYKPGYQYAYEQAEACRPPNVGENVHLVHCAVTAFLVDMFRGSNDRVPALWKECQRALDYILAGQEITVGPRPLVCTCKEGLILPNGMKIRYTGLRKTSKGEYRYLANARKKEWTNLYGGKVVENIVQALSRIILTDQQSRVIPRLNALPRQSTEVCRIVSSTHDELIGVVPERHAETTLQIMKEEMSTPPSWCPDIPLKSSGGFAVSYGGCEK